MCTFARVFPFKVAMFFTRKLRKVQLRNQGCPVFYTINYGQKCQNGSSVKAKIIHFIRVFYV